MRNARFWQWVNGGWVKLTLKPGQTLAHHTCNKHDEGWTSTGNTWAYDAETQTIESTLTQDGLDCDGRSSYHCSCWTTLDKLRENEFDEDGAIIATPRWERGERVCYDQYAEQAGY